MLDDRELHVVTLAGGADRTLFTGAISTDERDGPRPVWSPDGQYIAFPLLDARAFVNVQVVPAAGGVGAPGQLPWQRADGRHRLVARRQIYPVRHRAAQRGFADRPHRPLARTCPSSRKTSSAILFKPGKQPGSPDAPADTPATPAPKPLPATAKEGAAAAPPAPKVPPVQIVWAGLRNRATILPLALNADTPVISADGKTLVFRAQEKGRANLYSYNLDELADEPPVAQQADAKRPSQG